MTIKFLVNSMTLEQTKERVVKVSLQPCLLSAATFLQTNSLDVGGLKDVRVCVSVCSMSQEAAGDKLYEISVQEEVTARLHFIKFENAYIETCLDFIKDHLVNTETKVIKATGGGAHKFKELIERKLGLK